MTTERAWQAQVLEIARYCRWEKAYHTFDSRRSHAGFPDLVLVRERVVFAELKRDDGRLSEAQEEWIAALDRAGAEVYVWRPRDLDEVGATLSRWVPAA